MKVVRPRAALAGVLTAGARRLTAFAHVIRPPARATLVLGGARSGKSAYAEGLFDRAQSVTYVATGEPPSTADPDWAERVWSHQERRPSSWRTVETLDVAPVLADASSPVLLDCLATWLTRIYDRADAWQDARGWRDTVDAEVDALVEAWASSSAPIVAVSNEVGSGVVPETAAGRLFRDGLGTLNQRVAEVSDRVTLIVAGRPVELKE